MNKAKSFLFVGMLMFFISVIIGCSQQRTPTETAIETPTDQNNTEQANQDDVVLDEYQVLLNDTNDVDQIIEFVETNVNKVSPEHASKMLVLLEERQKEYLLSLEEEFFTTEIQQSINEIYSTELNLDDIAKLENQELKELLLAAVNSGYKVETAEGMYYPIIDYQFYNDLKRAATDDIQAYFTLMEVESSNPPAKDAALVISWDEIINRAINQEGFLVQYPNSLKTKDVQQLYNLYIVFTLYGANNTPLFHYDTKQIDDDAKAIFIDTVAATKETGKFHTLLEDYLEVLKNNNFTLTEDVQSYRDEYIETHQIM